MPFQLIKTKKFITIIYCYFFSGSVLMRSAAGCIVNDIVDKDFDKNVSRTNNDQLASGKISVSKSLFMH